MIAVYLALGILGFVLAVCHIDKAVHDEAWGGYITGVTVLIAAIVALLLLGGY